tara:strand:+ start:446 stop:1930 length:1485 start_codon:yes stop_codon:yes gene_type:complete
MKRRIRRQAETNTGPVNASRRQAQIHSAPASNIFDGAATDLLASINFVEAPPKNNQTDRNNLGRNYTILPHPLNIAKVIGLKDLSTHHAACIQAKKYSTVGLGFYGEDEIQSETGAEQVKKQVDDAKQESEENVNKIVSLLAGNETVNSKVDDLLDDVTFFGFQNELINACEDFIDTGTGYLEVARATPGSDEITSISHIPAADIRAVIQGHNLYYEYTSVSSDRKFFSLFGRKDWLFSEEGPYNNSTEGTEGTDSTGVQRHETSEVITFVMPTNRVKFYGYPDWLSAAVDIDLTASAKQYKADFYRNRGVLDFIIAVTGTSMGPEEFKVIEGMAKGASGKGKNFRNAAINLANPEAKLQVERLAMDMNTEEQFAKDNEVLAQNVVSAHRVPPLLANILIPGKLGASNEFINALIGFQLLVIGPYQQIIQKQLGRTLGDKDLNGGLDLTADSFRLRTITSQINITGMDAISKSRSEATDGSENEDRDFDKGVKE